MSAQDEFTRYLERRIAHVEGKRVKIASYEKTDRSQLNADQLLVLDKVGETEGSRKELDLVKEQYGRYSEKRVNTTKSDIQNAYEKGKKEALAEFTPKLNIATDFLKMVSEIYKKGGNIDESGVTGALYKLLEIFYSGGDEGAHALASLVNGSEINISGSNYSFGDVNRVVMEYIRSGKTFESSGDSKAQAGIDQEKPTKESSFSGGSNKPKDGKRVKKRVGRQNSRSD